MSSRPKFVRVQVGGEYHFINVDDIARVVVPSTGNATLRLRSGGHRTLTRVELAQLLPLIGYESPMNTSAPAEDGGNE